MNTTIQSGPRGALISEFKKPAGGGSGSGGPGGGSRPFYRVRGEEMAGGRMVTITVLIAGAIVTTVSKIFDINDDDDDDPFNPSARGTMEMLTPLVWKYGDGQVEIAGVPGLSEMGMALGAVIMAVGLISLRLQQVRTHKSQKNDGPADAVPA